MNIDINMLQMLPAEQATTEYMCQGTCSDTVINCTNNTGGGHTTLG
jgi:hypothetical protein